MVVIPDVVKALKKSPNAHDDVKECFAIADYVYFLSQGKIVAHGTPADMMVSTDPYVHQFVNAEADGPVPFHYPGKSLADDLGLGGKA